MPFDHRDPGPAREQDHLVVPVGLNVPRLGTVKVQRAFELSAPEHDELFWRKRRDQPCDPTKRVERHAPCRRRRPVQLVSLLSLIFLLPFLLLLLLLPFALVVRVSRRDIQVERAGSLRRGTPARLRTR